MHPRDVDLLKEIDPVELGQRLRAARTAKGWTQTELAGGDISVGYVSRIESGQRRPNASVLDDLAGRLDIPVDHLLRGVSAREYDEIRLTLDFAELSLESGEAAEALTQATAALERALGASQAELTYRAHFLRARALEGVGHLDDAIIELEPLVADREGGLLRIKSAIAISRCYRESGDFILAVDAGERVLAELDGTPLEATDESVQLAVTVAAAYFERGDIGQAVRTCRRAVSKAERLESPRARASAYWNSSIMEAKKGATRTAVQLAERAIALLSDGQDARNLARLRTDLGVLQLRMDPPAVDSAREQLAQAADDLLWSSAGPVETARNDLALARVHYLSGDFERADEISARIYDDLHADAPLLAADAKSLEGQAAMAMGDRDRALATYRQAVFVLTGHGADRSAADLWFELADLLQEVGELDLAREAYRSAAASVGVRGRPMMRKVRQEADSS